MGLNYKLFSQPTPVEKVYYIWWLCEEKIQKKYNFIQYYNSFYNLPWRGVQLLAVALARFYFWKYSLLSN